MVQPAAAATTANDPIVVNSTGDQQDSRGGDGVCSTAFGTCTLRAAITQANYNRGPDLITFGISGSGVKQIRVTSTLPALNDPSGGTTIDGYTQAGAAPNTSANGSNAKIRIEVVGGSLRGSGIKVQSAENTIRGLSIYGFYYNVMFTGEGADGNRFIGNFVGPNAAGNQGALSGTQYGVVLELGPDRNQIGTPDLADRNVISGNVFQGLRIQHGETSENRVQNNVIGLTPNLSNRLGQRVGMDVQWYTWGNLIGGTGANEGNIVSGNLQSNDTFAGGVDLSHSATNNLVIGNYIGTLADGDSVASYTANTNGLLIKDNAKDNYIADNVIANSRYDGIRHRHNYTGTNTFVANRVGVGVDGGRAGNGRFGINLTGHDDLYLDNRIGHSGNDAIRVTNYSTPSSDPHTNYPPEKTLGNRFHQTTFINVAVKALDIDPDGANGNDLGDRDDGPHLLLNFPEITGHGAGAVRGKACANCTVEVSEKFGTNSNWRWIGSTKADSNGSWSILTPKLTAGEDYALVAIDPAGNTSEFRSYRIPSSPVGIDGQEAASLARISQPAQPKIPPLYVPVAFDCSYDGARLSWDDAKASSYYIWATTDGVERYLGGHSGTKLTTAAADSYRVEHWANGYAVQTDCDGPGQQEFSCTYLDGTLTWNDGGADQYYLWATTAGIESYLGGHTGTSLKTPAADSYRIEHWNAGQTTADCEGPGGATFSCSYADGALAWDNAGANQYYLWATTAGTESYLGGHTGTSLTMPAADSYRVEHWNGGQITATC